VLIRSKPGPGFLLSPLPFNPRDREFFTYRLFLRSSAGKHPLCTMKISSLCRAFQLSPLPPGGSVPSPRQQWRPSFRDQIERRLLPSVDRPPGPHPHPLFHLYLILLFFFSWCLRRSDPRTGPERRRRSRFPTCCFPTAFLLLGYTDGRSPPLGTFFTNATLHHLPVKVFLRTRPLEACVLPSSINRPHGSSRLLGEQFSCGS